MSKSPYVPEFAGVVEAVHAVRAATKNDFPIQYMEAMLTVVMYSGDLSAKQIAERVSLTPVAASKVLRGLERDYGYIVPYEDENDARIKRYWITPRGRKAAVEIFRAITKQEIDDLPQVPTVAPRKRPKVQG